ncbi:hypothetical protein B0H13DRAFT_621635 [Mycena leptocephala]|nr:hypothetical protein B0H13DRAFT_621635 [Mycena leptocephala]
MSCPSTFMGNAAGFGAGARTSSEFPRIYMMVSVCLMLIHFPKVRYATCDNAANNGTMLVEFVRLIKKETGPVWNPVERRIGCLAHVINVATQKLISEYSRSPHFNAHESKAHIPDTSAPMRDEIGLVRMIAVKECSSSKRKDPSKRIQLRHQTDPAEIAKEMVLDMKMTDASKESEPISQKRSLKNFGQTPVIYNKQSPALCAGSYLRSLNPAFQKPRLN